MTTHQHRCDVFSQHLQRHIFVLIRVRSRPAAFWLYYGRAAPCGTPSYNCFVYSSLRVVHEMSILPFPGQTNHVSNGSVTAQLLVFPEPALCNQCCASNCKQSTRSVQGAARRRAAVVPTKAGAECSTYLIQRKATWFTRDDCPSFTGGCLSKEKVICAFDTVRLRQGLVEPKALSLQRCRARMARLQAFRIAVTTVEKERSGAILKPGTNR